MMPAPRYGDEPRQPEPADLTGVVLAGGLGRRMSADGLGTNKALVLLDQRPLIAHVIERLAPQVGRMLINVNADLARFAGFGVPLQADLLAGHPGPLAGLHAAMSVARTDYLLTVPCDAPNLPTDLASRLCQAAGESGVPLVIASAAGRAQPVFMLAARILLPSLVEYLSSGRRSVEGWYRQQPHRLVEFADASLFANINTAQDLAGLVARPGPPDPR